MPRWRSSRTARSRRHGARLIGANAEAIHNGEDRQLFKETMLEIGLDCAQFRRRAHPGGGAQCRARRSAPSRSSSAPPSRSAARAAASPTTARNSRKSSAAASTSRRSAKSSSRNPCSAGRNSRWKSCATAPTTAWSSARSKTSIPMGVHTGDSITVAPIQTLTDKEYQIMRDASFAVIREIGVETGGSNIQFAVNPKTGRMIVIEMNPRVSRSSALASKATGFPIAKIAAKLAVGYTLDELKNDITRETPACFEPTIDYCVVKVPRFTFEKFPQADPTLTTQMKSVGEAMAIGRTFKEALQKALRSLETGRFGLGADGKDSPPARADGIARPCL